MSSTDPAQVVELVNNLRKTFNSEVTYPIEWRKQQLNILKRLLVEGNEELCEAMYKDLHRSRFEANMYEINALLHEIQYTLDHLEEWMAPQSVSTDLINTPGRSAIKSDPLGVVAIFSPWNYPVNLVFTPLIGAFAGGNVALLRPAHFTVHTTAAIVRLVTKYFDPSIVAVVSGDRHVTTAVLEQRFDLIFFTGGPTLGKVVTAAAAKFLTPVVLELGGKSPAIVDKSCDLDIAAKRLTWGSLANAGQTCVRCDYIMVHEDVADRLVAKMRECIKSFYVKGNDTKEFAIVDSDSQLPSPPIEDLSNPELEQSPFFGRIVNGGEAFERLSNIINHDRQYIVEGGQTRADTRFIAPTVLYFKDDFEAFKTSAAMEHEIFGPLIPIVKVKTMSQAIEYVREHEKPLALYCFTTDNTVKDQVATRTSSGGLVFNDVMVHLANYNLPFGGVGMSGMGAYHGKYSFATFTHQKAVLYKYNFGDVSARYPPYTTGKQTLMNILGQPVSSRTVTILKLAALAAGVAGGVVICKEYLLPAIWPSVVNFVNRAKF